METAELAMAVVADMAGCVARGLAARRGEEGEGEGWGERRGESGDRVMSSVGGARGGAWRRVRDAAAASGLGTTDAGDLAQRDGAHCDAPNSPPSRPSRLLTQAYPLRL